MPEIIEIGEFSEIQHRNTKCNVITIKLNNIPSQNWIGVFEQNFRTVGNHYVPPFEFRVNQNDIIVFVRGSFNDKRMFDSTYTEIIRITNVQTGE